MAEFTKNETVDFKRGALSKDNAKIIAVVTPPKGVDGKPIDIAQSYVIEHASGWTPNALRIQQYGLSATKKYLFVREDELS